MPDMPEPLVTRELVERLEKIYPDRCPSEGFTDRQVWIASGAAKVVRKLRSLYDSQSSP